MYVIEYDWCPKPCNNVWISSDFISGIKCLMHLYEVINYLFTDKFEEGHF